MPEYSVLIETSPVVDSSDEPDDTPDETSLLVDELTTSLALLGGSPALSVGAGVISVRMSVEATSAANAVFVTAIDVKRVGDEVGVDLSNVTHAEATEWSRFEADLEQPNFPDVVGGAEVAKTLSITKQRLQQLQQRTDFPEPIVRLAAGPIWLRSSIDSFLERWDRTPGRPAHKAEAHGASHSSGSATATVIGAGAIAALLAEQLARTGVKELSIVDADNGGWAIKAGKKQVATTKTKSEAIRSATVVAKATVGGATIRIHGKDGRIQEVRTFGPLSARSNG